MNFENIFNFIPHVTFERSEEEGGTGQNSGLNSWPSH